MTTKIETAPRRAAQVLDAQELRALLAAPNRRRHGGHADAALLAVLFGTGARVGEVVRLRRHDIERGPRGTLVLTFKTSKRRDHPLRAVVLDRPFVRYLKDYLEATDPRWFVWPSRRSEAITVRCAQRRVMKYVGQIGRGHMRNPRRTAHVDHEPAASDEREHLPRREARRSRRRAPGDEDVWSPVVG